MKLAERTTDQPSASGAPIERPTNKGQHWSPKARADAVAYALEQMIDGNSLDAAAREMDINPGTLLGWVMGDKSAQIVYENSKIQRSRALMERALDEAANNPDYKKGESLARTYMRMAALLNPNEFSDKMHANVMKHTAVGKSVSFTLIMHEGEQDRGALTVIAQPDIGELP